MIALLAREAFQVVDVSPRSHHHLEGWYDFAARRTVAGVTEQPQIVPPAEYEVCLRVQRRADLP